MSKLIERGSKWCERQPATAVAVRSLTSEQIADWIKEDEEDMADLRRGSR